MKTNIEYSVPASSEIYVLATPVHSAVLGLPRDQRIQAVDEELGTDFITSEDETHEDTIIDALDAHRVLGGVTIRDFRSSETVNAFLDAADKAGWEVLVFVEYDEQSPYTDFILYLK